MSGDLNPFLQAALPGAIAPPAHGDAAPLLRLRRSRRARPRRSREFSSTLNVATTCADVRCPTRSPTPPPTRWTLWRHGADALPDGALRAVQPRTR